MKSSFNFEKLFKRLPNVAIPKEFIGFGIGSICVLLVGLIAGNMYLQEMLFIEGVEKSVPYFTEEELREYGELYKELSLEFQNKIGAYCQDYANRTNRAGEKIHYGIYNHEHPELNTSKIHKHNNGANVTSADMGYVSELDDSYNDFPDRSDSWATCIDTDEFKNGVTVKYTKTEGKEDGAGNYQDILTVASMVLDQRQTSDGTNEKEINVKEKAPEVIKNLFKMSHTFTGTTTQLYPCEKGCRVLFYFCNEEDSGYKNTGIDLVPFEITGHDDFDDYSSEEFEIASPLDECEICGHNGKGCELDDELCWHNPETPESDSGDGGGDDDEEDPGPHYLGRGKVEDYIDNCSTCFDEYNCKHECGKGCDKGCKHTCDNKCYDCFCGGHKHYNCPGHFYVCCMGHTDVTINTHIMYVDEMVDVIKNGYSATMGE
jgi:hypothetical protein